MPDGFTLTRWMRACLVVVLCAALTATAGTQPASPAHATDAEVTAPALVPGSNWGAVTNQHDAKLAPCADVLFVAARGSGEQYGNEDGMGQMLKSVRDGFKQSLDPRLTVKQVALSYPAYPLQPNDLGQSNLQTDLDLLRDQLIFGNEITQPSYFFSIQLGASTLLDLIATEVAKCGTSEKIVLGGYSAGAWVVHIALGHLPEDTPIAGVVLIADPARSPGSNQPASQFYGSATKTSGVATELASFVPSELLPYESMSRIPDSFRPLTYEVCGAGDPVCDAAEGLWSGPTDIADFIVQFINDIDVHSDYGKDLGAVSKQSLLQIGDSIAARLRQPGAAGGERPALVPDPQGGPILQADHLATYQGSLYFAGAVGSTYGLFRQTGSSAPVAIDAAGLRAPSGFIEYRGSLYFTAHSQSDAANVFRLFSITGAGSPQLVDSGLNNISGLTVAGDTLFFGARNASNSPGLYRIVGGAPPALARVLTNFDLPFSALAYNGSLIFDSLSSYNSGVMYRVAEDTAPVVVSSTFLISTGSATYTPTVYGGSLYFNCSQNGDPGLCRITGAGNAARIGAGQIGSPSYLTAYAGRLFFTSLGQFYTITGNGGPEPFAPAVGLLGSNPTVYNGKLYFVGWNASYPTGRLFRMTDTQAPQVVPTRLGVDAVPSDRMVVASGNLYFAGPLSSNYSAMYRVVGDGAITEMPRTNGLLIARPNEIVESDGSVFFTTSMTGTTHAALWRLTPYAPSVNIEGGDVNSTDRHNWQVTGTTDTFAFIGARVDVTIDGGPPRSYDWPSVLGSWDVPPVTLADGVHTISVTITDVAGTTTTKTQSLTVHPPMTAGEPSIIGTLRGGQTVSVAPGSWMPSGVQFNYQWRRNQLDIAGATSASYAMGTADFGKSLSVILTATAPGYTPVTLTVYRDGVVAAGLFTSTPKPTIAGLPTYGSLLLAITPIWSPRATYSYQWARNGNAIAGATGSQYRLTAVDVGTKVTVTVTGTRDGLAPVSQKSAATAPVLAAQFSLSPRPVIRGVPTVGSLATAVVGQWSPQAIFTYQWRRNGVPIAGATNSTYRATASDAGKSLSVAVTARALGHAPTVRISVPIAIR